MTDIASLLREAAEHMKFGTCTTELVGRLEAAAEKIGEPVAWLVEHDDYPTAVELPDETHTPETIEKEEAMGWRLTPLYAAPQPAVPEGCQVISNETLRGLVAVLGPGFPDCIDNDGQPQQETATMSDYSTLLAQLDDWAMVQSKAAKAVRELEAKLAAAEADAERYRWLKSECVAHWTGEQGPVIVHAIPWSANWERDLDNAIDAARSAK